VVPLTLVVAHVTGAWWVAPGSVLNPAHAV
jgi:hypothetical protein